MVREIRVRVEEGSAGNSFVWILGLWTVEGEEEVWIRRSEQV